MSSIEGRDEVLYTNPCWAPGGMLQFSALKDILPVSKAELDDILVTSKVSRSGENTHETTASLLAQEKNKKTEKRYKSVLMSCELTKDIEF